MKRRTKKQSLYRLLARATFGTVLLAPAMVQAEGSAQVGTNQNLQATSNSTIGTQTLRLSRLGADILDVSEDITWTGVGTINVWAPSADPDTDPPTETLASGATHNTTEVGAYTIEVNSNQGTSAWDITVSGTAPGFGRVFSTAWNFFTGTFASSAAINASFYALVPGGAAGRTGVMELRLDGMSGNAYFVGANQTGVEGSSAGRSVPTLNNGFIPDYRVYLNPPEISTYDPLTPVVSTVDFSGGPQDCDQIAIGVSSGSFEFTSNIEGTYHLVCDLNDDGIFDRVGADDYLFVGSAVVGTNTATWNGLDNSGAAVAPGDYDCRVFLNTGEMHYVAWDIETAFQGQRMFEVASNLSRSGLDMFWNDTEVQGNAVTMPAPLSELGSETSGPAGVNSGDYADAFAADGVTTSGNAHAWGNFTAGGKGNSAFIDTFTYLRTTSSTSVTVTAIDPTDDADGDNLTDYEEECVIGTNPGVQDTDLDGVNDDIDDDPLDRSVCSDLDADSCDDCSNGISQDVNNDGPDNDGDGTCNDGDPDDDGDGSLDADDSDDNNPLVCSDNDADSCDDCSSGTFDVNNDGPDNDANGICNDGDPDDDGDGSLDADDSDDNDNTVCSDVDADSCDDCSSGTFDLLGDGVDFDLDGACDAGDLDDDNDGALDPVDSDDNNPLVCSDVDVDLCDDCSSGTFNVSADGPDNDTDGLCNAGDPDDDNDGSLDADDSDDNDPTVCSDTDSDTCDDCSSGSFDVANDGPDNDGNGVCNDGDPDDDGDGSLDGDDSDDNDPTVCSDTDSDTCDDCSSGSFDVANDGPDNDGNGVCNDGDPDDDGDGSLDADDSDDNDPTVCSDTDSDTCDDCSSGTFDVANDGPDNDGNGVCNDGDPDDDGDGSLDDDDSDDNDPLVCSDVDVDTCDDCSSGTFDLANDGLDTDMDGACDIGDDDTDNDGSSDDDDSDDTDPTVCSDTDSDGCDDCSSGMFDPANDGDDLDGDGICDEGDDDTDGDGTPDDEDDDDTDPTVCSDTDGDGCDDCASGSTNPSDDGSDSDGDGLCDDGEEETGSDPEDSDSDDDGVPDDEEPNGDEDTDGDGLINRLDPDSDNDGILDGTEMGYDCSSPGTDVSRGFCVPDGDEGATTTDPLNADTDVGGASDGSEDSNLNGVVDDGETDPTEGNGADDSDVTDSDDDGLGDDLEETLGTDPNDGDTDDDGVPDGDEPNPSVDTDGDGLLSGNDVDSDNDGLFDGTEMGLDCSADGTDVTLGHCTPDADPTTTTSPLDADTDDGGATDGSEDSNLNGAVDDGETDPTTGNGDDDGDGNDEDGDGLSDDLEETLGSDPNDSDSDDDGIPDGDEPNPGDDHDGDGVINVLDPDSDDDGIFDGTEAGLPCDDEAIDLDAGNCIPDADDGETTTGILDSDTDDGGVSDGDEDTNRNGAVDEGEGDPLDASDDEVPACVEDFDCGESDSGLVCDEGTCVEGCRGSGGNSCADGLVCTSSDETIGSCENANDQVLRGGGFRCSSSGGTPAPSWPLALLLGLGVTGAMRRRRRVL